MLCPSEHYQRKDTHAIVAKLYSDADHVLTWKELPDGTALTRGIFESFMSQTVQAGSLAEETVGGIEGQLRARKKREAAASASSKDVS